MAVDIYKEVKDIRLVFGFIIHKRVFIDDEVFLLLLCWSILN